MQEDFNTKEKISPTILKTDEDSQNGQNKCPKCGATDISLNSIKGILRCNYCHHEFSPVKIEALDISLETLEGQVMGSGAKDIEVSTEDIVTLKCSSCGAEVVIDTASATQARCHWCRNTLSINEQIPNGSIPDVILPFCISKEEAKKQIEVFVSKRKSFAHPKFKTEFNLENVMGVYFPYMMIDANTHAVFTGKGEHLIKKYTRGSSNAQTYYDCDLYEIEREFDLIIQGLTIESNKERLNQNVFTNTNNVINAIMPFDMENVQKYNANFLKGYTSEKRNMNVEDIKSLSQKQIKDIARFACNETLTNYDRGVCFEKEKVYIKGERWLTAYLPVWLYSYQQIKKDKKVLHYVAVNGRTKEIMGSVPIHYPKLFGISFIVEILGILLYMYIDFSYDWVFLFLGFVYFLFLFFKYRNSDARHVYEVDTKKKITNVRKVDNLLGRKTNLTNASMIGANNKQVSGVSLTNQILNTVTEQNSLLQLVKKTCEKEREK